jgi:hypothetical protein
MNPNAGAGRSDVGPLSANCVVFTMVIQYRCGSSQSRREEDWPFWMLIGHWRFIRRGFFFTVT